MEPTANKVLSIKNIAKIYIQVKAWSINQIQDQFYQIMWMEYVLYFGFLGHFNKRLFVYFKIYIFFIFMYIKVTYYLTKYYASWNCCVIYSYWYIFRAFQDTFISSKVQF